MEPAGQHRYPRICGELELPIALVDLSNFHVLAMSRVVLTRLGMDADQVLGRSILDLLRPDDRPKAAAALQALDDGIIDFYRSHRPWPAPPGKDGLGTQWVRAVELGGVRRALLELGDGEEPQPTPMHRFLGREPRRMAVGLLGPDWTVSWVSSDIEAVVGVPPEEVVGRRLVDTVREPDVQALLEAAQRSGGDDSVALRIEVKDCSGEWQLVCCVLSAVAGEVGRFFILMPEGSDVGPPPDPSGEVDAHLRKIASEVDASGMLERLGVSSELVPLPQMAALTARQWEVLSRLLLGDRVPTIASDLFISPSTVRNHLAAIYELFGVHSQAELIQLVRKHSVRT